MVEKEKFGRNYLCSMCGLCYADENYAQKCEEFCKEHKGCSMEITKHAVKKCSC